MTPGEFAVITAIKGLTRQTGYPPSYVEIGRAAGIPSKSGVHRILNSLRDRGCIYFENHRNRSAVVLVEYEGHRPDILARIGDDALDALVRNALAEQAKRQRMVA